MAEESDGIEEAVEGAVRLATMAGARLGAQLARERAQRLRDSQRRDDDTARQLRDRLEAEKRVAVADLRLVQRREWWERASATDIGQQYATARAWAPESPDAAQAEQQMRQELQSRYGVDVDRLDSTSVAGDVDAWHRRLEQDRVERAAAHQRDLAAEEHVEAGLLLGLAAQEERNNDELERNEHAAEPRSEAAEANRAGEPTLTAGGKPSRVVASGERADGTADEAEIRYDSAERREEDARAMQAQGVEPEVVTSRMQADLGAGTPPRMATRGAKRTRAPKARKASSGRGAQVERGGVER